jgi:hypothetical protein
MECGQSRKATKPSKRRELAFRHPQNLHFSALLEPHDLVQCELLHDAHGAKAREVAGATQVFQAQAHEQVKVRDRWCFRGEAGLGQPVAFAHLLKPAVCREGC